MLPICLRFGQWYGLPAGCELAEVSWHVGVVKFDFSTDGTLEARHSERRFRGDANTARLLPRPVSRRDLPSYSC